MRSSFIKVGDFIFQPDEIVCIQIVFDGIYIRYRNDVSTYKYDMSPKLIKRFLEGLDYMNWV